MATAAEVAMTVPLSAAERAAAVIEMLLEDGEVPDVVRRLARSLRPDASDHPHLVIDRLQRASAATSYPFGSPAADLAKVVTLERYWNHYASRDVKAYFPDSVAYRSYVERQADPGLRLMADLKPEYPLIPARHSWVTSHDLVAHSPGRSLVQDLELEPGTEPPLAVLVIPADRARNLGVQIRRPRATDAVGTNQFQWRLGGLASGLPEWVDRDIPRDAVSSVLWRP